MKQKGISQATSMQNTNNLHFLFLFFLALAGLIVYSNSLAGPFLLDDEFWIVKNTAIRSFSRCSEWVRDDRPVLIFTLALNYAISKLDVRSWHVLNITIHILSSFALFGWIRNTLKSPRVACYYSGSESFLAFAISLLWLVHPLQTQSVNYIIQRAESLAGLFYLLTLYAISKFHLSNTKSKWALTAIISCALGILTKETIFTCPILVLIYDRIFLSSSWSEILKKRKGLYIGLFLSWGLLAATFLVKAPRIIPRGVGFSGGGFAPLNYFLSQPNTILHYLHLSFWPSNLCFDYLSPLEILRPEVFPPLIAVTLLLSGSLFLLRFPRSTLFGFCGISFFLFLAPSSSFLPIADVAAEHRMYLPLASVIAAIVIMIYGIVRHFRSWGKFFSLGILTVATLLLSVTTFRRNQDYKSAISIWQDTVNKQPLNTRAHANLGMALHESGQIDEAAKQYREAIQLNPENIQSYNNLGIILTREGKFEEAQKIFERALEVDSHYAVAHGSLGFVFAKQGKINEAAAHYKKALQIDPYFVQTHANLAGLLLNESFQTHSALNTSKQELLEESIRHYKEAIRLDPDHPMLTVFSTELKQAKQELAKLKSLDTTETGTESK